MSVALTTDVSIADSREKFDYTNIEEFNANDKRQCQSAAKHVLTEIQGMNADGIKRLVNMGKYLSKAHGVFAKKGVGGQWGRWLDLEANGLSRMVANRAIRLFEGLADKEHLDTVSKNFNIDAALLCVADDTPNDVLEKCVEMAKEHGTRITKPIVEQFIQHEDPELIHEPEEEPLSEEQVVEALMHDFKSKLYRLINRECKDMDEDTVHMLPSAWTEAYGKFMDNYTE